MQPHSVVDNRLELNVEVAVVEFRPLADWWANKIQWCEDDHEDLVQEGLLELVKTIRGYQKSGKEIQDLKAIASVCFSAAMKWWYKKSDRELQFVPLEGLRLPVDNIDVYISKIFVDTYLKELESVHGIVARTVVENLLSPGPEVAEVAIKSMEAKKEKKASGQRVVGYASPRVHRNHIREALCLDSKEWDVLLMKIKHFTQEFLCRSPENKPGSSRSGRKQLPQPSGSPTLAFTTR